MVYHKGKLMWIAVSAGGRRVDTQGKDEVRQRLLCVHGHLGGVIRMVDENHRCLAVALQIQAIQGALRQINTLLLTHHLDSCLRQAWGEQRPDEYRQLRDELLALLARKEV